MTIEQSLQKLESTVKSEPRKTIPVRSGRIPNELRSPERQTLSVGGEVLAMIESLEAELAGNVKYEHLGRSIPDVVWKFVCKSKFEPKRHHSEFVAAYQWEVQEVACYFTVEDLIFEDEIQVGRVSFVPLTNEIPRFMFGEDNTEMTNHGAAMVKVSGTHAESMLKRGRLEVEHALRILRLSLAKLGLSDLQLRFRLGQHSAMDGYTVFQRQPDASIRWTVSAAGFAQLPGAVAQLAYDSDRDSDKTARFALSWLNQAYVSTDRLNRILFLFFALEALLGDVSDGEKARALAYYRTALGQTVSGEFSHPSHLYYFYDKVRSAAVHGSDPPEFSDRDVKNLEWNVRDAFYEYIILCKREGLSSRGALQQHLRKEPLRQDTLQWLRENEALGDWATWIPGEKTSKAKRSCAEGGANTRDPGGL